jgi:hypothetical protein
VGLIENQIKNNLKDRKLAAKLQSFHRLQCPDSYLLSEYQRPIPFKQSISTGATAIFSP